MNRLACIVLSATLTSLPMAATAQAVAARGSSTAGEGLPDTRPAIEMSLMYSAMHAANPSGGSNNYFWMNGGIGDVAFPVHRHLSVVGEWAGHSIMGGRLPSNPTAGLSLISGMGGVRVRIPTRSLFQPYAQALIGGAHGFNSYFMVNNCAYYTLCAQKGPTSYDSGFNMALGAGVDLAVSKHVWIRVVQTDYSYTVFRNTVGNRQNNFRVSGGLVFRLPDVLYLKK